MNYDKIFLNQIKTEVTKILDYITIYETDYFKVEVVPKPHVSREEGGHLRIKSKEKKF